MPTLPTLPCTPVPVSFPLAAEAAAAAAGGAMPGDLAVAVSRGLESAGAGGGAGGPREGLGVSGSGVEVPNLDLLDDETREQVGVCWCVCGSRWACAGVCARAGGLASVWKLAA